MGFFSAFGRKLGISGKEQPQARPYAERLSDAANAGDVEAMIDFGDMYFYSGCTANARKCYQAAADAGSVAGDAKLLHVQYLWREDVPQERITSVLKNAQEVSHDDARVAAWFAQLLAQGEMFGQKDPDEAMKYAERACELGSAEGWIQKAFVLKGKGDAEEQVIECLRKAVELGSVRALCSLAMELAATNPAEARSCLEKAAHEGYPGAFFMLGMSPLSKNRDETERCVHLLEQAAKYGSYMAQQQLFSMFGERMPEEYAKYVEMAAGNHWPPAMSLYGMMLVWGGPFPTDREKGMEWLREAVKFDVPEAMTGLALAMLSGAEKSEENVKAAVPLLMRAAVLGHEKAMQELEEIDRHVGSHLVDQVKKAIEEGRAASSEGPAAPETEASSGTSAEAE